MVNKQRMMKLIMALLLALVVGLAACSSNDVTEEPNTDVEDQENVDQTDEEEDEQSGSVTFTDKSGVEITIEEKPERIISTIASATEIVFAVGAGDRVVGVTEWDNYPEEVFEIEKVGDMNLNIEKIVELEPDVIISDLNNGQDVDTLRDLGLTVVVLGSQSLEDVYEDIELAGLATWNNEEAQEIIDQMKENVAHVEETVSGLTEEEKKSVWLEVDPDLYSGGKGSFMDELINLAGGINIIGDMEGWPQVSEEIVLERDPDVIITTYGHYFDDPVGTVLSRNAWQNVTAVENEQVFDIHSDLLSRPGPRLVDGLLELATVLYPDLFE